MFAERLCVLADTIERLPAERFDMTTFIRHRDHEDFLLAIELETDCGTAGCIAGWACAVYSPDRAVNPHRAAEVLGLSRDQANALFFPSPLQRTPYEAAAALRGLARTGVVAWA